MENDKDGTAGKAPDMDAYAQSLSLSDSLREPAIRSAIRALQLPPGSRGLDAGCGIGSRTLLLARAVAPAGHVTGLDISPELLAYAREAAERSGLSEQVSFREGDVNQLPFDDDTFDWVWSADCVGYGPWEPLPLLMELARVVKPGGIVAILAWSSEKLLITTPFLPIRCSKGWSPSEPSYWSLASIPYRNGGEPTHRMHQVKGLMTASQKGKGEKNESLSRVCTSDSMVAQSCDS